MADVSVEDDQAVLRELLYMHADGGHARPSCRLAKRASMWLTPQIVFRRSPRERAVMCLAAMALVEFERELSSVPIVCTLPGYNGRFTWRRS